MDQGTAVAERETDRQTALLCSTSRKRKIGKKCGYFEEIKDISRAWIFTAEVCSGSRDRSQFSDSGDLETSPSFPCRVP